MTLSRERAHEAYMNHSIGGTRVDVLAPCGLGWAEVTADKCPQNSVPAVRHDAAIVGMVISRRPVVDAIAAIQSQWSFLSQWRLCEPVVKVGNAVFSALHALERLIRGHHSEVP